MEFQFIVDLLTNIETIIGVVMASLAGVVAMSKKVRRKLKAATKAVKETK